MATLTPPHPDITAAAIGRVESLASLAGNTPLAAIDFTFRGA